MERYELITFLGDAEDQLDEDDLARLHAESDRIDARYPDPDDEMLRQAAFGAAAAYLLGDISPEQAAKDLTDARLRESGTYAAALQVAVMAVASGETKAGAARRAGIDRMSLLKALGER